MNTVRTFFKNADVKKIGVVSFYAYFAINILMKAFSYDHGDNIYKCFFIQRSCSGGLKWFLRPTPCGKYSGSQL